ncbi:hypothetical protein [Streptomyces antibioticus]
MGGSPGILGVDMARAGGPGGHGDPRAGLAPYDDLDAVREALAAR